MLHVCILLIDALFFTELLSQWKRLKEKTNRMQEFRTLEKEIVLFKEDLNTLRSSVPSENLVVNSIEDIQNDIELYSVSSFFRFYNMT